MNKGQGQGGGDSEKDLNDSEVPFEKDYFFKDDVRVVNNISTNSGPQERIPSKVNKHKLRIK